MNDVNATDITETIETVKNLRKPLDIELYTNNGITAAIIVTIKIGKYTFCKYIRIESFNLPLTIINLAT